SVLLLLDYLGMAQVHQLLYGNDVVVIMMRRVVAQHVHDEPPGLLDHRKTDASRADDGDGLSRDLVAKEGQEWVPRRPLLVTHKALALPHLARQHAEHEKSELSSRFGEHVGGIGEWYLVLVSVGSIDVVEADGNLRHNLERALPCFKNFGVDRIAERCDQAVDAAFHFFDDQFLRRRLRPLKNFKLVAALAKTVLGRIADAGGSKDAEAFLVSHG